MVIRNIIKIDEELCTGCGNCVVDCAEGALQIIDGKAKVVNEVFCDGLGACIGNCPTGALTIEHREAEEFSEESVEQHLDTQKHGHAEGEEKEEDCVDHPLKHPPEHDHEQQHHTEHGRSEPAPLACGCPGSLARSFDEKEEEKEQSHGSCDCKTGSLNSQLRQWPIQFHLLSPHAPYFKGADVLLAADCTAFSLGAFHPEYLKGKILAIACPKLDTGQEEYLSKLVSMIDEAKINTLTVMIMTVPCCGGLLRMAQLAVQKASRKIPIKLVVVGVEGDITKEEWV